jgi:glycosyltransferase involved in cell wall biosynthesis
MSDGVSVIVPSFEAWPVLHRTLEAVVHDCVAWGGAWEVIVVDNESGPRFTERAQRLAAHYEHLRLIRRSGLGQKNFQPGAARNLGIEAASHPTLVFLDADCVPSAGLIQAYYRATRDCRHVVFVGHRIFVDAAGLAPAAVATDRRVIGCLEPVRSTSNYGYAVERRMAELETLDVHPRPYDCMYACNMAMHRDCLSDQRFAPIFDGYWGYEDIELGYRLHRIGRIFQYLPEAFVYHQEGGSLDVDERALGRKRNFLIAAELIYDFVTYRRSIPRVGAAPDNS